MKELPKAYEPQKYEKEIYQAWEASGFFNPDVCIDQKIAPSFDDAPEKYFSMVLPPPNVTGTLHMGHAVMLAIQDVMARYHRMKGERTLWVPGTDHAAVATESKVESKLIKEKGFTRPKEEMGREAFLAEVRQFAQESHDTIVNQAKRMGASLDWSREAYTLDDKRNLAVRTVFKKMYDDGLIYRGYRVINWSVKGQSTCSDDELVYVERPGKLYTFKYSQEFPITIATTRPETKLGDTAVAVHPEGRWKDYIGKEYEVHNVGQIGHTLKIKIIGDEGVDDSFGTGALGVTPAHSTIDFEMYQKQKAAGDEIGFIQVIGEDGKMTSEAGADYAGLSVKEAREKFVAYLQSEGLLEKEEETMQNVGTSDRFGDVVEPLPKTQWFVSVNSKFKIQNSKLPGISSGQEVSLKELMQHVVREKQIGIVPERFTETYFRWIDNLRDWNISRQIWFGHQVPVWYRGDEVFCGVDAPEGDDWAQDPDTLDTWFSSGLWTFSTLGWPEVDAKDLHYHPTSVLETGYDIIFFWVARMILMSTYAVGEIPFRTVYLHGLVRDEQGRKMSKSLGNILDPLEMCDKYGTDATRLSLIIGTTPGNDSKLSEAKVEGLRNFANKLWNISRFMLLNIEEPKRDIQLEDLELKTLSDKWIVEQLKVVKYKVGFAFNSYSFSFGAENLRDFTWGELADWYLEIVKDGGDKKGQILNYLLNEVLKLWHPYMPFVTEAIWSEVYPGSRLLMVEKWGDTPSDMERTDITVNFGLLQYIVQQIRTIKNEYKIPGKEEIFVSYISEDAQEGNLIDQNKEIIIKLAGVKFLASPTTSPSGVVAGFPAGATIFSVYLPASVDIGAEKERLQKEIDFVTPFIAQLEKKLSNKEFVDNAPKPVVEKEQQKLDEAKAKHTALRKQLEQLEQ